MLSWLIQLALIGRDQTQMHNNISAKNINAEPATRRIARQIEAQNERANQSVLAIDDLTEKMTRLGIKFRGNAMCLSSVSSNE